ncbi:MAG: hypothetical protein QOF83_2483 [Solirubrobacteraceae bacterium]|jgi:hypothetical protein|nr:hypothetical protein [Solirubrobacteraceae bacterium]
MSSGKLVGFCLLAAVSLSGCGIAAKPQVGSSGAQLKSATGIDDPRVIHVDCLRAEKIPVSTFGRVWMQIGTKPSGPTVQFTPTPGAAQEEQISGQVESAEVIGAALLYPNQASDSLLQKVEGCVAKGVSG